MVFIVLWLFQDRLHFLYFTNFNQLPCGHEVMSFEPWKQPLAQMLGKVVYKRLVFEPFPGPQNPKVFKPFLGPYASRSYVHQTALF
jgi:hypothetical protein